MNPYRMSLLLVFMLLFSSGGKAELATAEVRQVVVPRVFRLDGTVEAVHKSTISAQTSGQIEAIYHDVDDLVEKGTLLVKLKDTEQQAALRKSEAELRAAQAMLKDAESAYRRIKDLYDRGLVAKSELDTAQASLKTAAAKLDAARAALQQAREQLSYTRVTAPYSGIVTERHVQVGEVAHPGTPLMSGISLEKLRVSVDVPQSLIVPIRKQRKGGVELPDGRWLEVSELTIFPFADPASNTFKVRLMLPSGLKDLFPGMLVKSAFETGRMPVLVVPSEAVAYRSEVTAIYVVDEEGRISFRHLRLGGALGEEYRIVLAGLQVGDRVALDPVQAGVQLKNQRKSQEAARD